MALAEDIITSRYSFQAYDTGEVTINEKTHRQSLIVSPNELIEGWPVSHITDLNENNIASILGLKPDIILLGTGETQIFPPAEILGHFARNNQGVEIMNTGALCRTFNILVAEDRNVVAGIIL